MAAFFVCSVFLYIVSLKTNIKYVQKTPKYYLNIMVYLTLETNLYLNFSYV